MSDNLKHDCGLAYIRLLQPLSYYHEKYGTAKFGMNKLFLLMEKQRNRGQQGAGIAAVKLGLPAAEENLHRLRISGQNAITGIYEGISREIADLQKTNPDILARPELMKAHMRFAGELLLGHLRYGTQGKNSIEFCHPFIKQNVNPFRRLAMAGNFNLVNTEELFTRLMAHPTDTIRESDLGAMIETIHHFLRLSNEQNPDVLDIEQILHQATSLFDGGYVFCGLTGNGDSFVMRDPNGIRPCSYYINDEVVVAASERAAIMTAFNVPMEKVIDLPPGHALIVNAHGTFQLTQVLTPGKPAACSFERIYFSRGSDPEIYQERMQLGRNLAPAVLAALDYHLRHTIVSFIPNTAETSFYGLIKGLEDFLKDITLRRIMEQKDSLTPDEMKQLLYRRVRIDKIIIKDEKLRTFISDDATRIEMVQHAYDITYGTVERDVDTLVVIDDSIVRGTTLRESIIRMLDRLGPKRIIVVSAAPQIRYPDCYGIDMSRMGDFIAFQAAVALLRETGREQLLRGVYSRCLEAQEAGSLNAINFVKDVYAPFTDQDLSAKIATMIRAEGVNAVVDVIYQSLGGLAQACPNHTGTWYFTGDYPTPGGNRVANRAFMNYMERDEGGRGY